MAVTTTCAAAYNPAINPTDFTTAQGRPNRIGNPYLPLPPGTTWTYRGEEDNDPEVDVVSVTHQTKAILGVTTTVVQDTVSIDGTLAEATSDWYAQDDRGAVWYFGEDSKEYDSHGHVTSAAGSWQAGVKGAKPGVVMEARPAVGDTYRQEFAKGEAEDMATVLSLSERVTVPVGSFANVVETKDFSCIESEQEHKFFAPGVGMIRSEIVKAGNERLLLASVKRS